MWFAELLLFFLSYTLKCVHNLPYPVVFINNFGCVFEPNRTDIWKSPPHIADEVFNLISLGFIKFFEVFRQTILGSFGQNIQNYLVLRIGQNTLILFFACIALEFINRKCCRQFFSEYETKSNILITVGNDRFTSLATLVKDASHLNLSITYATNLFVILWKRGRKEFFS